VDCPNFVACYPAYVIPTHCRPDHDGSRDAPRGSGSDDGAWIGLVCPIFEMVRRLIVLKKGVIAHIAERVDAYC
jgi:hypothetical protein